MLCRTGQDDAANSPTVSKLQTDATLVQLYARCRVLAAAQRPSSTTRLGPIHLPGRVRLLVLPA